MGCPYQRTHLPTAAHQCQDPTKKHWSSLRKVHIDKCQVGGSTYKCQRPLVGGVRWRFQDGETLIVVDAVPRRAEQPQCVAVVSLRRCHRPRWTYTPRGRHARLQHSVNTKNIVRPTLTKYSPANTRNIVRPTLKNIVRPTLKNTIRPTLNTNIPVKTKKYSPTNTQKI